MGLFHRARKQERPTCAAVIVAAGSGQRMQGVDKIMAELQGRPVIVHTISAFEAAGCVDEIVVVARPDQVEAVRELVRANGFGKVRDVVPGGDSRVESVQHGLMAISRDMELAAVQDGARPLVTGEVIARTVEQAARCHAAAPAVPVKDTIKEIDQMSRVVATPDRSALRAVQTPQVFQKDLLLAAWEKARQEKKEYTDDCGAMEAMGVPVYLTEGDEENLKITTQLDLHLAEYILSRRDRYENRAWI